MSGATRAEIEQVAISLYESDCRYYDKNVMAYGSQLAFVDNQVRAAVVSWASHKSWTELHPKDRERWRNQAVAMLDEAHPYVEDATDRVRW